MSKATIKNKAQAILTEKESKILPSNIKKDVTIFNVTGSLETTGTDTSDATATANDIVADTTAYVKGVKISGNIRDARSESGITDFDNFDFVIIEDNNVIFTTYLKSSSPATVIDHGVMIQSGIPCNNLANNLGITADKIREGYTILGIEGTYGSGRFIEFVNNGSVAFYPHKLANILYNNLTAQERSHTIYTVASAFILALEFGTAIANGYNDTSIIGLSVDNEIQQIDLTRVDNRSDTYRLSIVDSANPATSAYYKPQMNVNDLINLLNALNEQLILSITTNTHLYMYDPVSFTINFNGPSSTDSIFKPNIPNDYLKSVTNNSAGV